MRKFRTRARTTGAILKKRFRISLEGQRGVIQGFGDRRGVNDEIVGRMVQNLVNLEKRRFQDARQVLIFPLLRILKTGIVRLWEQPDLKPLFFDFEGLALIAP